MEVIFVCTGNTCRSPIAEGYLKSFNIKGLNVKSAGICADGSPVSTHSQNAALELGFDISAHISTPLKKEDLCADMIICMSPSHREILINLGAKADSVFVLGNGIPDPFGQSETVYRYCAESIMAAIDELVFGGAFTEFKIVDIKNYHVSQIARLEKDIFSTPWSEQSITESVENRYFFFVAEDNNQNVLGYVGMNTVLDEGYIANVAVKESCRTLGIGNLLIKRLLCLAKKNALAFLSLEVRATNEGAISLYKKNGFKAEGRRKDFYSSPREDAIIMTRRFN